VDEWIRYFFPATGVYLTQLHNEMRQGGMTLVLELQRDKGRLARQMHRVNIYMIEEAARQYRYGQIVCAVEE
jgi:hypothetical protein